MNMPPKNAKQKEVNDWIYNQIANQQLSINEFHQLWENEHKIIPWYKSLGVWLAMILTILVIIIVANFYLIDIEHMKITIFGYTFSR